MAPLLLKEKARDSFDADAERFKLGMRGNAYVLDAALDIERATSFLATVHVEQLFPYAEPVSQQRLAKALARLMWHLEKMGVDPRTLLGDR